MNFYRKLSIRNKLILIILTANIVTLVIAFAVVMTTSISEYKKTMGNNIQLHAKLIAEACQTALNFEDQRGAEQTMSAFRKVDDVCYCALFDKNLKLYAEFNPGNKTYDFGEISFEDTLFFDKKFLMVVEPVVLNNKNIGVLYVKASKEFLNKKIDRYAFTMIVLLVFLIFTAILLAWVLQKIISRPILRLAAVTRCISSSNDYSVRAQRTSEDEIGVLYDDFNSMISQIQSRDISLRESEERFKQMTESAFDAIVLINQNGNVYFWNRAAFRMFGYTFSEVNNMNFYELLRPSVEFSNFIKQITEFNQQGKGKNIGEFFEFYATNSKKERFPIEISAASLFIDNQWHIICIVKDITERKNNEAALLKAKDDAEESDRLKSAFLANMSHEIRTPMNSIIGFADLLKNTKYEPDKFKKYLEIIHNNGRNLLNLIDDILDLSKIEAGQLKIKQSESDIHVLIDDLYSYFSHEIKRNDYAFTLKLTKPVTEDRLVIKTDAYRMRQIFGNLLSNAFKFTNEGEIEFGYEIENKDTIKFFVKDTGIGIPEDKHRLIFERFGQVDSTLTKNTGGTGLGLNIAKRLVELLGGKIWVESEVEIGSTFYFTTPYIRFDSAVVDLPEKELYADFVWADKKILIAEDELANYLLIRELIVETKAIIIHAKNGREAVDMVKSEKIDVVLMDINMPIMDGYEATREIKLYDKNVVVVAQTAYAMSGEREKAVDAGCDGYITKPINGPQLLQTINKFFL